MYVGTDVCVLVFTEGKEGGKSQSKQFCDKDPFTSV